MIQNLQKFSQSRLAKFFLAIVALSFVAFFGGGDWFRPHDPNATAAEVGPLSISRYELAEKVQQRVQFLLSQPNQSMTREDILAAGLPQMVLSQLIQETLLDLEGEHLGLTVSDDTIRQYIQTLPTFQNEQGMFERGRFAQILRSNGMSEDTFIEEVRQQLIREELANAIMVGAYLPDAMVERLFDAQYEHRQASMLVVQQNKMPAPPPPSEEDLEAFYKDHQKEFKTPELRTITAIIIDPTVLAKEISVSLEDIKATYEARPEVYGKQTLESATPLITAEIQKEKSIEKTYQITQDLDDKIAGGATFEELAPTLQGAQLVKLEGVDAEGRDRMKTLVPQLPQNQELAQEILKTAFSLEESADSPFAQAQNGAYYALRVDKIAPAAFQPFQEIKDRVLKVWTEVEQLKAAYTKAENYVNAFNRGDRKISLMTLLPSLSLSEPSPTTPDEVKNLIFTLRPGKAGMERTGDGFAVVVLNTIIPPTSNVIEKEMPTFKKTLLEHYKNDLLMGYINALRIRYPVKVNTGAIKSLFPS